jgi:quercetin dioxygenase-like cupin family protein
MMAFIDPSDLAVHEPRPGFRGRFFHSDHMTFSYYDIDAGADVHPHRHPQEEVWHLVAGEAEVTVAGETRLVRAGGAAVVPAEVEHSVRAVTACRAIVVDHPVRDSVGGVDIR